MIAVALGSRAYIKAKTVACLHTAPCLPGAWEGEETGMTGTRPMYIVPVFVGEAPFGGREFSDTHQCRMGS